ncbi:MAG: hypothetical protein ACI3YE_04955, partial [Candidatus Avispirillum sp.]
LILNFYEFIDKTPEKLQGKKQAKTGKNRSKSASNFVVGISVNGLCGLFRQNGEKFSVIYAMGQLSLRIILSQFLSADFQV